MRIRKLICILLVPFLAISFFASGAAAKPSCNENTCRKMAVRTGHHQSKPMALASDCCARHQQVPCELERRQSDELSVFCVSACRPDNYRFFNIIDAVYNLQPQQHPGKDLYLSSSVEAKARSVPIYLQNLSIIR